MRTARILDAEWRQVLQGSVCPGSQEDKSSTGRIWAAGFHHVTARSRVVHVLKIMNHLFLQFSHFFAGGVKLRITETADAESLGTCRVIQTSVGCTQCHIFFSWFKKVHHVNLHFFIFFFFFLLFFIGYRLFFQILGRGGRVEAILPY
jgi:hypothetical protein